MLFIVNNTKDYWAVDVVFCWFVPKMKGTLWSY